MTASSPTLERARALVADALECPLADVPAGGTLDDVEAWDSIGHVRVVMALEQALGRSVTPDEIAALRGVADVAAILDSAG